MGVRYLKSENYAGYMKLQEVAKVKVFYDEDNTNIHLERGFRILKILSSKRVNGVGETVVPCFVLGKANGK